MQRVQLRSNSGGCINLAKTKYDIQAENFLNKFGLKITFEFISLDNPNWDKTNLHNHYKVTITRKGKAGQKLSFQWWDSIHNTKDNIQPTAYDALTTISSNMTEYANFNEFCSEFGYDNDSINALNIYKEYSKLATRINKYFTEKRIRRTFGD